MNTRAALSLLLAILIIPVFFASCKKEPRPKLVPLVDEAVYTEVDYTDRKIDSPQVATFLATARAGDSIKNQVARFYQRRDYQFGWFTKKGMTYPVNVFYDQLIAYRSDFRDSTLRDNALDSLVSLARNDEKAFLKDRDNTVRLDLMLTLAYFKYAEKVYGGMKKNPVDLEWFIPRKKKDYQMVLDSLVSRKETDEIKEPENQYYARLKKALRFYRSIEESGGFPNIESKKELAKGDTAAAVAVLKSYLRLSGDYVQDDTTAVFTDSLAASLKNYQGRMGLLASGRLNKSTIDVLNVPVSKRIRQIMINLERLRWVPEQLDKDLILVNIPEFRLHFFSDSKLIWNTGVVVGKEVTRTSIFTGNMANIVLNPYWNVPASIVKNEIKPAMARDPNYISRNNMEIVSRSPLQVRQKPGKNNALGKLKFLFPNNFSIYLHDTPAKSLFTQNKRAYSHGCVRVEDPVKLARLLLQKQPAWLDKIDKILKTDKETWIPLRPTMPVYIVYFTTWVDQEGRVNFRNDIYGHDKKLGEEIFGKSS